MTVAVDPILLDEVKSILRRDLKLGPTTPIPDGMPLIGGDMDLDSLDILLVVSSIEKHFKIKIPNEVVGRWVFQDVSTLTKFVQETRSAYSGSEAGAAVAQPQHNWLDLLPHGPGFRFITEVREVMPGKSAIGVWNVKGSERFFAAHFPGNPLVPGVYLIEGLAQIAGLATAGAGANTGAGSGTTIGGVLAHADVKFETPVIPPASIQLQAVVTRSMGTLTMCDVTASVSGRPVARGTVAIKTST